MNRIVQVLGSVRIFTPFIAAQRGSVTTASNADLTRNFVGASVLTVLVGHERQYGGQSRRRMNCCGPLDRPRRGSFSTETHRALQRSVRVGVRSVAPSASGSRPAVEDS